MSRPNKNPLLKEISEPQTAKIPVKNITSTPKFRVDDYALFKSASISQEEIDKYLEYCRKVYPCKDNKLGIIFTEDISVQKALQILHKYNYNLPLAKFHVTFPVLSRYCQLKNIQLDASIDYQNLIDDFAHQKSVLFTTREKTFFDELNNTVIERASPIFYKDIEEMIQEGIKKRYTFPDSLRGELAKSEAASSEITNCLRESKVYSKIDDLFVKCNTLMVIPKNIDELVAIKLVFDDIMSRTRDFIKSNEKDIKVMHKLINDIKMQDIDCTSDPALEEFQVFAQTTHNILEKIQILSRPYRGKEAGQKFSLTDVFEIMEYFHKYSIKNEKNVADLAYQVYLKEIEKENCMMFLEDEKENDPKNFVTFIDDLRKCALDYDVVITLTDLKIQTLEITKFLAKNLRNERLVDENLKRIDAYEKLNSPFNRKQIMDMKSVLMLLKSIDRKIDEIEKKTVTIFEFLFGTNTLMDTAELLELLNELKAKGSIYKEIQFVQRIVNFVNEFENESHDTELLVCTDLKYIIEKTKKLLVFGFKNETLVPKVQDILIDALEIEYYIVKFLDKFTYEKVSFDYPEFEVAVRPRIKGIPNFETGVEVAKAELDRLFNNRLKERFLDYCTKRDDINLLLNSNASRNLSDEAIEEIEKVIKETFKDKELLTKLKIIIESKKRQNLLVILETRLSRDFVMHKDIEAQMVAVSDCYLESQKFFASNIQTFFEIYRQSLNYEEEISKDDLDELFGLLSKQFFHKEDFTDEFFIKIKQIKEIIGKHSLEFQEIMKDDEKGEGRYVLKVFHLILIFYKIQCLGIKPEFCKNIQYFVDKYIEIEHFLNPTHKKTIREIRYHTLKHNELKLFSPSVRVLKEIVALAYQFKEVVEMIEHKFNGDMITSNEMIESIDRNIKMEDYDIEIVQNSIFLGRRKFDLLENKEFQNFLNSTGKRIKKFKAIPDNANLEENELNDPANINIKRVIPVVYNNNDEFCMCRETYEIKSMMQHNICDEWYHQECIKMPNYLMEKNKDDFCFGCDFLERRQNEKTEEFQKRKIAQDKFKELTKTYFLLKEFILDEEIDFVGFLIKKLSKLVGEIESVESLIEQRDRASALKGIHTCAVLYLYIPVRFVDTEQRILELYAKTVALE